MSAWLLVIIVVIVLLLVTVPLLSPVKRYLRMRRM